ncbi:hypothetical protein G6L46_10145 [Agrobacterium rhizogenes]|uniref:glycine-rich domain-containing protein n=1 Tax=Rhizobium rhizogenes TaxID=359 RepID=UPI0015727908|nr:hypothetical protein [Rhizobium rhizogenes]NTF87484.1 hypothetical protein [Rhizobium rhizogenes]
MKYQAPYGSLDPDAPYVDRNSAAAVKGSALPAAAIEDPQREIVGALIKSGIVPADDDLLQLAKAMRSQQLNYFIDGGAANAISIALDPAPSSWNDLIGVPLRIKIAAGNTGPTTLAVAGLTGTKPVTRVDASAASWFDIIPGQIAEMIYDGTNVQLNSLTPSPGRLLNIKRITASGTYTPTSGTNKIIVRAIGGGGGGGGAVANGASQSCSGSGGAMGSFAVAQYTSAFSSVAVTIGAAGSGGTTSAGGNGGTTSFGALLSCPGGGGGQTTQSTIFPIVAGQGGAGSAPTGSGILYSSQGQPGLCSLLLSAASVASGQGAASPFGGGGQNTQSGPGNPGTGFGSGGSGASSVANGAQANGGSGVAGFVLVEEYS